MTTPYALPQTHSFTSRWILDGREHCETFTRDAKGTAVMLRNEQVALGRDCTEIESVDKPVDPEIAAKLARLGEITGGGPVSLQDIADAGLLLSQGDVKMSLITADEYAQSVEANRAADNVIAFDTDTSWEGASLKGPLTEISRETFVPAPSEALQAWIAERMPDTGTIEVIDEIADPLTDEQVDKLIAAVAELPDSKLEAAAEIPPSTTEWVVDLEPRRQVDNDEFAVVDAEPEGELLPFESMGIVFLRKYANKLRKDGKLALSSAEVYSSKKAELIDVIRRSL